MLNALLKGIWTHCIIRSLSNPGFCICYFPHCWDQTHHRSNCVCGGGGLFGISVSNEIVRHGGEGMVADMAWLMVTELATESSNRVLTRKQTVMPQPEADYNPQSLPSVTLFQKVGCSPRESPSLPIQAPSAGNQMSRLMSLWGNSQD